MPYPNQEADMVKSIRYSFKPIIAGMLLTCLACGGGYTVVEPGPPAQAPAYGYRYGYPNDRVVLVYDPALRVYAVTGYPHYYYSGGRYYRLRGTTWYRTSRLDGPWRTIGYKSVPSGLQHKYYKEKPAKQNKAEKSQKHSGHGNGKKNGY
jgi:hypothetical protein